MQPFQSNEFESRREFYHLVDVESKAISSQEKQMMTFTSQWFLRQQMYKALRLAPDKDYPLDLKSLLQFICFIDLGL